eukprot:scaffold768_cov166-Amphora_coffeaeformis.AAC.37
MVHVSKEWVIEKTAFGNKSGPRHTNLPLELPVPRRFAIEAGGRSWRGIRKKTTVLYQRYGKTLDVVNISKRIKSSSQIRHADPTAMAAMLGIRPWERARL